MVVDPALFEAGGADEVAERGAGVALAVEHRGRELDDALAGALALGAWCVRTMCAPAVVEENRPVGLIIGRRRPICQAVDGWSVRPGCPDGSRFPGPGSGRRYRPGHVRPLRLGVLADDPRRALPRRGGAIDGTSTRTDPPSYPDRTTTSRPGPRCPVVAESQGRPGARPRALGARPVVGEVARRRRPMINARAESLLTSNAYKRPFARRRCIVPADGFYEWQTIEGRKAAPAVVHPAPRRRAARVRGALVDLARPQLGDDAPRIRSCTIITTEPNELMRADPRPDAGDPARVGVGHVARRGEPRRRRAAASCSSRRRPTSWRRGR